MYVANKIGRMQGSGGDAMTANKRGAEVITHKATVCEEPHTVNGLAIQKGCHAFCI